MFVSFNGKLWAGAHRKYVDIEDTLLNSDNGITWDTASNGEKAASHYFNFPTKCMVANGELWYIERAPFDMSSVIKTNNLISHTHVGDFEGTGNGYSDLPHPVFYMNKVLFCSSKESSWGEFMTYIDNGQIAKSRFEYPGSVPHTCIVFNNKLYSISNNGVYSVK